MRNFWKKWTNITKKIAGHAANILLILLYFLLIVPVWAVFNTFSKKTLLGHGVSLQKNSFWIKRQKVKHDMAFAKEQ